MTPHPDDARLLALADATLPPAEKGELEAHLAGCETCRRAVEEQRAVSKLVAGLPLAELPPGFLARLARRRSSGDVPAARVLPSLTPWRLAAFAATGVLVTLVFFREVRYRMAPEMLGASGPEEALPAAAPDSALGDVAAARERLAERGAWSGVVNGRAPALETAGAGADAKALPKAALSGGAPLGSEPSASNEAMHADLERQKTEMGIQEIIPPSEPAPAPAEALPDHPVSREEAMAAMRAMTRRLSRMNEDAMQKKEPTVALGGGSTPRLLASSEPSRPVAAPAARAAAAAPLAGRGAERDKAELADRLEAESGSLAMVRGQQGARVDEPASFDAAEANAERTGPRKVLKIADRWSSTQGGLGAAGGAVITNAADWTDLWRRVSRPEPPPALDFSKQMAVAVFGARDESERRAVSIVSLSEEGGRLVIRYRVADEHAPGPSAPYTVVVARKSTLPFNFVQVP